MWQRSGDLTGSWKAIAARWHGLLVCTRSPCRQRSVHKKVFGRGVVSEAILSSPLSAQCQASGISGYGCEIFNYILPVSPSRHPRHHDQSDLTALLGARAVPTASFYRWENQVTELLHDLPSVTRKVCRQPGTGSPNVHPRPPTRDTTSHSGSACPHGHTGGRRNSSLQQGWPVSPHHGALLGCKQGVPISRGRGQNPLWGQVVFWKGCPQAVLPMAVVAPHTLTLAQPQKTTRDLGFGGEWTSGASALLEERRCLFDKGPER